MTVISLPDPKFSTRFARATAAAYYSMTERLKRWVDKQDRRHRDGHRMPGILRGSPLAEALALGALMESLPGVRWPSQVTPEEICRQYLASNSPPPEEVVDAIEQDLRQGILDGDLPVIGRPSCPIHDPLGPMTHLSWTIWLACPGDPFIKAAAWGFIHPDFRPVVARIWQECEDPTLEAIASVETMARSSAQAPPTIRRPRR